MYALSSPPPLKPPPLTPRRAASPSLLSPGGRRGRVPGSSEESHLRDLSPDTTLRAFSQKPMPYDTTRDEYKIFRCIETLTPAERDLGARVAKAAQRLKNWCREVEEWGWSGSFEQPSEEYREQRRKSLELRIREHVGITLLKETVPVLDYWGSLLSVEVEAHEARLDEIGDELLELDIEELKEHVLDMHPSSKSRPSSSGYEASRQNYKPMDDFSFLITQTLLSALPHHSQLKERLSTWTARVSILRAAPRYLDDLKTAQKAMRLGWEAIAPPTDNSDVAFVKWTEAVDTISGVLRNKVSDLGQRLDRMLDTLEGRADCLPEDWIDIFEGVEADLGRWTHESRKRVIEFDVRRKVEHSRAEIQRRSSPEKVDAHSDRGVVSSLESDQRDPILGKEPQSEYITNTADLELLSKNITQNVDAKQPLDYFAKIPNADPTPEAVTNPVAQPKSARDARPTSENFTDFTAVEPIPQDVMDSTHPDNMMANVEAESKPQDVAENYGVMSNFGGITGSVTGKSRTERSNPKDIVSSQKVGPTPVTNIGHTNEDTYFENTPGNTHVRSISEDIIAPVDSEAQSRAITNDSNVKLSPQNATETAGVKPKPFIIAKTADVEPKPEIVADHIDNAFSPAAVAVTDDIEQASPVTKHTMVLSDQHTASEPDSPIIDDDSIFEEGDTVVHNEIEEEILQDSSQIEPMSASFSDSPIVITTTEPENTEADRPRTPQSRRSSTASIASNVSFSSSPLSVTDVSPSIRSTSNRPVKVPRPELNAAMGKRRPAKPTTRDAPVESAPWPPTQFAHKSPTSADDLERKISDILTTIPAHIRLKTTAESDTNKAKHNRGVVNKSSKGYLRAARSISGLKSPELTLSPVKGTFDAAGIASGRKSAATMRGDNDIKLYHLTQPGKEHPIKLFIRRVGENGERVMVRVGGGWADLGEYLRQYAEHHGRRTVSDGKFEILGLEIKGSDVSPSRPESAMSKRDRRFSSGTQVNSPHTTPVKSSDQVFSSDEAPPPFPSFIGTPGVTADASAPSTGSTQRSWKGDEVGLAGPRTKKLDLSGEKLEWIEGMMKQARTVSSGSMANASNTSQQQNERAESRSESRTASRKQHEFGDLGKVGGTKRIFMRGGGMGEH